MTDAEIHAAKVEIWELDPTKIRVAINGQEVDFTDAGVSLNVDYDEQIVTISGEFLAEVLYYPTNPPGRVIRYKRSTASDESIVSIGKVVRSDA